MTLRCVYWEEPDWPVMRSSWFWRPDHGTDLGIEIINNSWTNTVRHLTDRLRSYPTTGCHANGPSSPPCRALPLPLRTVRLCPAGGSASVYLCRTSPRITSGALEEIREDLESGPIDCELEDTPQHSSEPSWKVSPLVPGVIQDSIVQFTVKKLNNKSASSNASPSPSPKEANPDDVIEYALYNTASKFKLKVAIGYSARLNEQCRSTVGIQ